MNKFLTLATAMTIALAGNAQTGGKVTGSIKDGGNQKIIDAATVSLLKAKDSSLIKAAVVDKEGNFSFEHVMEGNYLVLATSVGHTRIYSNPFKISSQENISVGVLQLVPSSKNLKEVVVNSRRPLIERKPDRMIVNVDASISNTGSTALEVLEKSPGITIDKDGNISLKGKQGVMIMVDGKSTYLSGPELTNMLRNMPSSSLDQIEIMTNPSAKYDAAGNSGIINIKTKKNKQKGFNGNLTTSYRQGKYASTSNSLNMNYRTGKINLFGSFSANYRNGYQKLDIQRKYKNQDKSLKAIFEQTAYMYDHEGNYTSKIGADLYLNSKTTLGVVLTGISNPEKHSGENTSYLKNSLGMVDSIVTAGSQDHGSWKNTGVNLNFRHQFDSTGTELTADLDYLNYNSNKVQNFVNTSYTPDWMLKNYDQLAGQLPSNIHIYSAKVDYSHPLKKGARFESGAKSSYVTTDNMAGYFNVVNNIDYPDYEKTNRFNYKENINAAYINMSKEMKKWSLQGGLRLENTNYQGHQFGNPQRNDSAFKNSYTNLFPTFFVGYNPTEKNQFSFSYGYRINRPNYEDLNPFLFFLDKYTYGAGNPFLKPMYSNVFEVNHTYRQFLTTTLNFSHTKDLFSETFEEKGFATVVRQGNYGYKNDASVSVNAQVPFAKWWKSNIYAEGRYNQFKGILYGEDINISATNFTVNVSNQLSFKKGWSAEVGGFYRTKGIEGQIVIHSFGMLNAGIQKQVIKNKGTVKLNINDILQSRKIKGDINFQNTEAHFQQHRDDRVINLSFSYRFGKPIKGLQKRKTGGAGDEQNRIKGSGN